MEFFRNTFLGALVAILLLSGFGYYYRGAATRFLPYFLIRFQPCERPITYTIASIDPRFGLSRAAFADDIKAAEHIWESPVHKQLFSYSSAGDLKISLIYDYRQKATDALRKLGIVINDDKSTYDALKKKYDSLVASYDKERARIASLVEQYQRDKNLFAGDVAYWNDRGGAPKQEYDALEQRRIDLNNQVAIINQANDSLSALVDTINATTAVLNKLIAELNLQVNTYNTIGGSGGKEFNEGEYVRNASGAAIYIYQFNDEHKLVRVLAHELGHALGLEHVENPKAIMYRLNESANETLTRDDIAALQKQCRIK